MCKTAYELRISDWSSYVYSSHLISYASFNKGGGRSARAGIQYRNLPEQLAHEFLGAFFTCTRQPQGIAPGGQIIPARTARGLRVRRDDGHARLDQIIPVFDVLGVVLAHQKNDGRGVRRAVQGELFLPAGLEGAAGGDGVDVRRQGQRPASSEEGRVGKEWVSTCNTRE